MTWSSSGMLFNLFWIFAAFFNGAVAKGDPDNRFYNPPTLDENQIYPEGTQLLISWTTTLGTFNISLRQQNPNGKLNDNGGNIFSKVHPDDEVANITWTVQTYGLDLSVSPEFYLSVDSNEGGGFTTGTFNITEPDPDASPMSPTTVSTTLDPTPTPDPTSAEAKSASSGDPAATSVTSTGKIALGLGVGVGVPLISLLAILAFLQYRGAKKQFGPSAMSMAMTMPPPPPPPPPHYPADLPMFRSLRPTELPPKMRPMSPQEVNAYHRSSNIPELPAQDYI